MARAFKFWAMVGVVMTALKLKDAYDDYQELPQADDGHRRTGPIALHASADEEALAAHDGLELDTTLPTVGRPKRKRHADCCVCCGLRCGIFWKAFGIIVAFFIIWQAIQLIFWAAKPASTGLENMPAFNTSLACQDAPYLYNPDQSTYSVPFNLSQASHSVQLQGDAYGAFVITNGAADATGIQYDFVLRSSDESLLKSVSFKYPTQEQVDDGRASSHVLLESPLKGLDPSSCMRFDIVLRVPPQLKELLIQTSSLSHIKFAPNAEINLDKLDIAVHASYENNLVLPTTTVRAKNLSILMRRGYLVGDIAIVDSAYVETKYGNAISNLRVHPVSIRTSDEPKGDEEAGSRAAALETITGDGRSDFFYASDAVSGLHRQISSKHKSEGTGELYLKYEQSEFSGRVEVKAGSSTVYGMHTIDFHKDFTRGWVGEEDGKDRISVHAGRRGWVGLYF